MLGPQRKAQSLGGRLHNRGALLRAEGKGLCEVEGLVPILLGSGGSSHNSAFLFGGRRGGHGGGGAGGGGAGGGDGGGSSSGGT